MDDDQDLERKKIAHSEQLAERAYDEMYEAKGHGAAMAYFSEIKENFYDAINAANRLHDVAEAERLQRRLAHIKAVYRSQFT